MDFKQAMCAILRGQCVRLSFWAPETFLYLGLPPLGFFSYAKQGVIWYRSRSGTENVWIPSESEVWAKEWEIKARKRGLVMFKEVEQDETDR